MLLLFHILLFYSQAEVCITATLGFCLKGVLMTVKKISYFRSNPSTKETITILDCGYHETLHGHYSAQKVVDHFVLHIIVSGKGTYQLREQTYHLQKNDCFMFPSAISLIPRIHGSTIGLGSMEGMLWKLCSYVTLLTRFPSFIMNRQ